MRRVALVLLLVGLLFLSGCHREHRAAGPIGVAVTTTTSTTTTRPAATTTTTRPATKCAAPGTYLAKGRPNPCLTPGVIRTSDPQTICVPGYASKVRAELSSRQWAARRLEVERRYGLHSNPGEIDHLLPLEGGGSNDLANLWAEAAPQYVSKDQAENALHAAICAREVTIAKARQLQAAFLVKWGGSA